MCCSPTRDARLPTPSTGARPHLHRDRWGARFLAKEKHCVRSPWRAARALFAPLSFGRPPTQHASRAARTWRGCVVARRGAHSSPRYRSTLDRVNTATGRRHRVRKVVQITFEFCAARPAGFLPRGVAADRPRINCTPRCADLARLCCGPRRGALLLMPSAEARPNHQRDMSAARVLKGGGYRV